MRVARQWVWLAVLASLTACGGGGGGGDVPPQATQLSVSVQPGGASSDVERAAVFLVRVPTATVGAKSLLDEAEVVAIANQREGDAYRVNLPADRNGLLVLVRGMQDARFTVSPQLELLAPVIVEDGDLQPSVRVSPVSDLALRQVEGTSPEAYANAVAALVETFGGADANDPVVILPLLAALQLIDFVPDIAERIAASPAQLATLLETLDDSGIPQALRAEFDIRREVALQVLAAAAAGEGDVAARVNAAELNARFGRILTAAGTSFDPDFVSALAAVVTEGLEGRSAGGTASASNLLRYIINLYELAAVLGNDALPDGLAVTLAADPNLAQLSGQGGAVDIAVPLLDGELLGDDDARRRDYYNASSLSPLNTVTRLIAGVTDANISDDLQAALALAQVREGQVDLARFNVRTQIFGTTAQAIALKDVGYVIQDLGPDYQADAKAVFDEAFDLYEDFARTKGLLNLDADDLGFFQTLIGDAGRGYVELGDSEGQARGNALLNEFVALVGGGEYSAAYARALLAFWRIAEAAVETALESGLQDAQAVASAEALIDALRAAAADGNAPQAASGSRCSAYRTGSDDVFYAVRQLYMQRAMEFYRLLNLKTKALAVLEEDLPETRQTDYANCRSATSVEDMVVTLVRMGEVARADALIATMIEPADRESAQAEKVLATADVERDQGNTLAAAQIIIDNTTGSSAPRNILYGLLYTTSSSTRGLAGVLVDRGDVAEAKVALDRARTYFQSAAFVDFADSGSTRVNDYFVVGGGRLVELYAQIGDTEANAALLSYLDGVVDSKLSRSNDERVSALALLGRAYDMAGQPAQAKAALDEASGLLAGLDAETAIGFNRDVLDEYYDAGMFTDDGYFAEIGKALGRARAQCCEGVPAEALADARETRANELREIGSDLRSAVYQLRAQLWQARRDGEAWESLAEQVHATRAQARDVLLEAADAAAEMGNAGDRALQLGLVAQSLGTMAYQDEAEAVLARIDSAPDRNEDAVSVASALLQVNPFSEYSAFTERTEFRHFVRQVSIQAADFARVDTDGDGLPNFFSRTASQAQIEASGLGLDPDSDDDGLADTVDRTPLDAANS